MSVTIKELQDRIAAAVRGEGEPGTSFSIKALQDQLPRGPDGRPLPPPRLQPPTPPASLTPLERFRHLQRYGMPAANAGNFSSSVVAPPAPAVTAQQSVVPGDNNEANEEISLSLPRDRLPNFFSVLPSTETDPSPSLPVLPSIEVEDDSEPEIIGFRTVNFAQPSFNMPPNNEGRNMESTHEKSPEIIARTMPPRPAQQATSIETHAEPEIEIPESSERFYQNKSAPHYAHLLPPPKTVHSGKSVRFAGTTSTLLEEEMAETHRSDNRNIQILTPLTLDLDILKHYGADIISEFSVANALLPRLKPEQLVWSYYLKSENLPTFIEKLQHNLKDKYDQIKSNQVLNNVPLRPLPLGIAPIQNPHQSSFAVPTFDAPTTFLTQNPTVPARERALFLQVATPAGQYHFRKLILHNLVQLRSLLAEAAQANEDYYKQILDISNHVGLEELFAPVASYRRHLRASEEANERADEHNTTRRHRRDSSLAPARPAPEPYDQDAANAEFLRPDFVIKDKKAKKENEAEIWANYEAINNRMEDAFFWRGVLLLEVRMTEAWLERVDVAGAAGELLSGVFAGTPSPGGDAGMEAAMKRWGHLGLVIRGCWEKVRGRLRRVLMTKGLRDEGLRGLRGRHVGELFDVGVDARELGLELREDELWWREERARVSRDARE